MSEEQKYDCTEDVKAHQERVRYWLRGWAELITRRAENHDESKLEQPEKSMFDVFTPRLKTTVFGSDEYKAALVDMGTVLKHHYDANRHHPEYYENGVNGMTLIDLVEMLADWMAAAQAKNDYVNLEYLAKRFGLSEQLVEIFANSLREEDVWNRVNGVPVCDFCPPEKQRGYVAGFTQKGDDVAS